MHLSTEEPAASRMLQPFRKVGGDVPEYFSSRTHFAKIEDKKSYCEKLGLKTYQLEFSLHEYLYSLIQRKSIPQTSLVIILTHKRNCKNP